MTPKQAAYDLIPLAHIGLTKDNPRKHLDETLLAELAESIKAKGVLEPILLRPRAVVIERGPTKGRHEAYELVAGERRFRAAKLAGLTDIPALIRDLSDRDADEIRLIENEQRQDLGPMEKAQGYQNLIDRHGVNVEELAHKVGKSPASIYGLVKLLKLPDKAKQAVDAGELSASTAQLIARIPGEKARAEAATFALHKRYGQEMPSFREVQEHIRRKCMIELKQAPFDTKDAALVASAGACTVCPKRTGNNRAEYPDGRADVCTDPGCFAQKAQAFTAQKAKDAGCRIVSAAERTKLLRWGRLDTQATPYLDTLLEPHLKPADIYLCAAPDGLHRLVKRDQANKLLAKHHKIKERSKERSFGVHYRPRKETKAQRQAEKDKQALEREITRELARQVYDKTMQIFETDSGLDSAAKTLHMLVAKDALNLCYGNTNIALAERLGLVVKGKDTYSCMKAIAKALPDQPLAVLRAFPAICVALGGDDDTADKILAALAIDAQQIEADVKARLAGRAPADGADVIQRQADQLRATDPRASRNGKPQPAGDGIHVQSEDYDEALRRTLDGCTGFGFLPKTGATDDQIRDEILRYWRQRIQSLGAGKGADRNGEYFGQSSERHVCDWAIRINGKDPRFWFGRTMPLGKPTLQGKDLIAQIRRVKGIRAALPAAAADAQATAAYNATRRAPKARAKLQETSA